MKKIFHLFLILSISLFIFGCGGDNSSTNTTGQIAGKALLDGVNDHSGIAVAIAGSSSLTTTTSSDGNYSLSDVTAGIVTLNFTKSGYASKSTVVVVSAGQITNLATVTLTQSPGGISGTVKLSGQTNHSGISISISVDGYSSSATTNSSGSYSFTNLSPGIVTLNFSKSGYDSVTTTNTITAAATTNISTVTLSVSSGSITGTVDLDGQTNDSGASVAVDGTSLTGTTAGDGSFTISNVPIDTYSLTISKSGFVTGNTSNVAVEAGQATDIGTITLYEKAPEYDMSSLDGSDNILSMTYLNGYLYIATNQKLYKVSTINPTTVVDFVIVTNNYVSMWGGYFSDPSCICIISQYQSTSNAKSITYNESFNVLDITNTGSIVPQAIAYYNRDSCYLYYNSTFAKAWIGVVDQPTNNYSVNETDIISLEYNNNYFYACNSTTIYKYDINFDSPAILTASQVGAGTDLVGIAHDGTYIWLIDATTKKLYKISDIL